MEVVDVSKRIRVASELYEILEREAEREGKTVQALVSQLVEKYVKEERKV